MAQIKSALELALERTKDIKGDKEGLEAKQYRETGIKLVSRIETEPGLDLSAELTKHQGKQLEWIREGMRQILGGCLGLPNAKENLDRFTRLEPAFLAVAKDREGMDAYLKELSQFFSQFLAQRDQLVQSLQKQLEPALRQKEEMMAKQTGRRVRLTIESDPEFSKYLSTNLDKLVSQYNQALDKVKEEVMDLLA